MLTDNGLRNPPRIMCQTDFKTRLLGSGMISRHNAHPYRKGMFISLSNSRMYYNELLGTFKRQYQSVLHSVGIKIGRACIQKTNDMPRKDKINSLIQKGIPIATACIHDYRDAESDGYHYQHCHLWVYNIHHLLPSDSENLRDSIGKIKGHVYRYIRHKDKKTGVDIRPVGQYKHYREHDLIDTDFHDYLSNSLNSPRRDCLVNYMAHNRHNPDVLYVGKHHQDNLMYMYADLDYIPINLSNRTVTTT